jgi:aryl-alcohol dehydrogenase-like predicted oxidoreductase
MGASRLAQLTENLAAIPVVPLLTPDVLARIDEVTLALAN